MSLSSFRRRAVSYFQLVGLRSRGLVLLYVKRNFKESLKFIVAKCLLLWGALWVLELSNYQRNYRGLIVESSETLVRISKGKWERELSRQLVLTFRGVTRSRPAGRWGRQFDGVAHADHSMGKVGVYKRQLGHSPLDFPLTTVELLTVE